MFRWIFSTAQESLHERSKNGTRIKLSIMLKLDFFHASIIAVDRKKNVSRAIKSRNFSRWIESTKSFEKSRTGFCGHVRVCRYIWSPVLKPKLIYI